MAESPGWSCLPRRAGCGSSPTMTSWVGALPRRSRRAGVGRTKGAPSPSASPTRSARMPTICGDAVMAEADRPEFVDVPGFDALLKVARELKAGNEAALLAEAAGAGL